MGTAEAYAQFTLLCPPRKRRPVPCTSAIVRKPARPPDARMSGQAFVAARHLGLRSVCHELRLIRCDADFPPYQPCGSRLVVRVTLIVPVRRAGYARGRV